MPLAMRMLVLLCMSWTACAAPAEKSILIYGDSLSAAYGIAQSRGWVALLGERMKRERPDYSVANASVSGETSAGGVTRIEATLARFHPTVVIVELGANDGLRGQPVGQMKINLGVIIDQSRRSGARVLLVGMKLPPNYGDEYTGSFERAFGELAKQHQVALVPFMLEGFAEKREYFQPDRIHPNADAQPLIVDRVWQGLKPLLK